MDRDKFIRKEAKRGGWESVEAFSKFFDVSPCECGKAKCKGWQVRYKLRSRRLREGNE